MFRIVSSVRARVSAHQWSSFAVGLGALAILGSAAVAALSGAPQQPAGRSADNIWQVTNQRPDGAVARDNVSGQFAIVTFNKAAFDAALAVVARDSTPSAAGVLMSLPMPDSTFQRFLVKESPILADELAADYPEIKTYSAQGIDDPTATARFGWTAAGFHSIHLSGDTGSVYIDPYTPGDTGTYIVVNKANLQKPAGETWQCILEGAHTADYHRLQNEFPISNGATLRTYKLAIAATGEYTALAPAAGGHAQGSAGAALARMAVTVNRVTGIYERDLAVRFTLVTGPSGNPTQLIYTNAATDPYTNAATSGELDTNQTNIDAVLGAGTYDVGHLFQTSGGGIAQLQSPCSGSRARGLTGSTTPTGDAFDVDYVAHELGHQFGGNHSFNGNADNCTTRSALHAYEVGSGVTIQAYAGICGVENLQSNSIDRFHVESLDEMTAFITGSGDACGNDTATSNTPPVINGGSALLNHKIPLGTPFMLNATATDANNDTLTYSWEQFDLGTVSTDVATATTDAGNRPLFRSYPATTASHRYFPSNAYILSSSSPNVPPATYTGTAFTGGPTCAFGTCLTGETMPTTARTMNFQLTVRDNRAGGGAFSTAAMTVTTVASTGPFAVSSQNSSPPSVAAGSNLAVTWSEGNTTAAPISAANVTILLSTDGGQTFPTVLTATTTNDGSESVTIPTSVPNTTTARIKVQAVGNIFFDVNDANFQITGGGVATAPSAPTKPNGTAGNGSVNVSWTAPANGGSAITGYQVQSSATSAGTYANVSSCPTNTTTTSCNVTGLTNGTQVFFKVAAINAIGTSAFSPASDGFTPTGSGGGGSTAPDAPTNVTGTAGNGSVALTWTAPTNTGGSAITGYQVQNATSASGPFTNTNGCPANNTTASCNVGGLTNGTAYFFKVAAINSVGQSAFSAVSAGITPVAPCSFTLSSNTASVDRLLSNETVTVTASGSTCARTASVASAAADMLTISSGASGTGSGTVAYQVSANPGTTTRTGTMTIAGQTFTVTQSADSYTVDITVQVGSTPVAGAFVALIGTGSARAGADMDADFAADGTRRKFGAVSSSSGIARFRGVTPGTFAMKAHSGGRSVTSGTITVSPSVLSGVLSMTSSSSALTTLGAYGAQTGTIVADGQTGVFYLNTTAIPSLYRTTDHGGNWSPVTLSSDNPATGLDASSTAAAPTTSGRGGEIATIVGNKVWYSFDFGLTWASMSSPTGLGGTPQMYWAHIADTASTVSQLFLTSSSSAAVHRADMTAATPSFSAMAASYKTNTGDLIAMGNGDTAPVIAVFDVVSGATKYWVVDATPANTDSAVSVSGMSPSTATNGATLTPGNVTLFKIGGPATGVEIVVGTVPVRAPNTVLLYSLSSTGTPASNARMSTCTASSCTFPTATVFKNGNDTTSTTSSFANPGIGENSLCSANFGAVGSISPLGGAGSVAQCWLTVNGSSLEARFVLGVNNNTGMAFDAGYDGTTNLVIISGDGQHGASKSARMTTSTDHFDFGVNRPYFAVFPNIAAAGTGSSTGGVAVQGITSAVIRQSLYQPSSATNMASVMAFSGGGRTIGSTDAGVTWFTLVDRGGARMDWWNGASSGSQWMLMGTAGAGQWMNATKLAAASDFTTTTAMTNVMNGSAGAVGPTDFAMSTSLITSPGVYGVKGIIGTDYVGLGSYDGAKLRIDLAPLTYSAPTVTMGTLIPLLEIAIPDAYVPSLMAGDGLTSNAATGSNAGSIKMAYCPASGSHSSVADALYVAMAAINTGGTGELRKITGLGAAIAASSTSPNFSSAVSGAQSLTVPAGSNLRDIAVNCADGTVWLARSAQNTGGGGSGTASAGILKSTNGGSSFTAITLPTGNAGTALQNVVAIDFNKTTTTQVVATSRQGDVLVSEDSAGTWRLVNDTTQAACVGSTTQCGRGFGGEEPGSFAMPPTTGTSDAAARAGDHIGGPISSATTTTRGLLGSGAGLFAVSLDTPGTVSVTPSTLNFAGQKAGGAGALTNVTAAQTVTVGFSSGAPSWTITASQPWISLSSTGGTGAGTFTVSIVNPSNVLGASTSLQATVTLTAPGTTNSPRTITVNLALDQSNGATVTAPVGQVDTPIQNATGVQGAIGVTGWVLDNIGVTGVKIYRNCLVFDNPASCQMVLGHNVVEVGDAAFLAGARTDVEASFSSFPQNNRAGWGYLMLTSMLPHVTNQQPYGGQGALTIYAVATDVEGNKKLLGRSSDPGSPDFATPTSITMANDSIAKPFGAIDTPGQGQTVSGVLNNFGWALTADSNTTGGEAGDILIPTNGSTMTVFIDSLPVALVAYNQCRGSVGNPVPAGVFCNDDVSNIFGNATPQPVLTSRTANATLFRNLDAGRAPIGVYSFNTATLSNGLHTIAWSVSDSAGRNEGIGSRFFNVLNSGADQSMRPAEVRGLALMLDGYASRTEVGRPGLEGRLDAGVWGRTGFNVDADWTPMRADEANRYRVRLPEQGRLELWLGDAVDAGYLVAQDGTLRDLPTGSSLNGAHFGWMPPVGYVGAYHLAFLRGGERIDMHVTVWPLKAAAEGESDIRMHLDAVSIPGAIEGWAFDPQAALGSGIGAVHVWARSLVTPPGGVAPNAVFIGAATLNVDRPDVARAFEGAPMDAGYRLTADLAPGTYEITVYAWNVRTARWEDARSVTTIVR